MQLPKFAIYPIPLVGSALVASLAASVAAADTCSVDPLVLPITNVTFPDGIAVNRGIRLVLGGQVQGLRMSTTLNNTRVRNLRDCLSNSTGLTGCEGSSGSVYTTTDGSFKQVYNLKDWDVSVVDPRPDGGTTVVQGYDVGNFTDGPAVISDFPFEVWANHDALNKSALALGPKSSVLQRLVANNETPSAAFSIDYGSRSELYPRDGQLLIGGINDGRYDSQTRATYPMWGYAAPVNCPLQVLLKDVILTNAEGNHSLFDDPGSTITACVDTIQNAFSWTPAMFATWQDLTRWVQSDADGTYTEQTYPKDREPLVGSLTIKLANGYTTVIPHYELVTHERGTDAQGKYSVINDSRVMAAVQAGTSDIGYNVPILGGVFLSQNYLHVDYSTNTFWLSPQVGNGTFKDRITPVCPQMNATTDSSGSSSGGDRNLALQVALPVVFVAVAIGLIAYFMFRRNRRQRIERSRQETAPQDMDEFRDAPRFEEGLEVGHAGRRTSELVGDIPDPLQTPEIEGKQLAIQKTEVPAVLEIEPPGREQELERTATYELDSGRAKEAEHRV